MANLLGGGRLSIPPGPSATQRGFRPLCCPTARGQTREVQTNVMPYSFTLEKSRCRSHHETQSLQEATTAEVGSVSRGEKGKKRDSLVHQPATCPLVISLQRDVKYIFKSMTSQSKGTHMPKDKPVTNILLDGGAEGFGGEHIPKTHVQPSLAYSLSISPVCWRLLPEQKTDQT